MVIGNYEFKAAEEEILDFWKKNKVYDRSKSKNKGKKQFYFLDGPPYTSGKIHLGHAWNKAMKDSVLRYKRMQGFDVWDRAGYDMHGLPTEHATEKKLCIEGKEQIEKYGVDKFIEECRKLCIHYMNEMNSDFTRLGVWMDFENAYQPITPEFIEGEWWLIKKAHENKRLYEGLRTVTWCAHDATALAKHELEYKNVTDSSIYLKFKLIGTKNEYLIVWTTTPWTIPFNLAVMANPDIDYIKAKVDDEVWIVAKSLTSFIPAVANKKFTILEEFKGEKLAGLKYEHPLRDEIKEFDEIEKTSPKLHTVVLSSEYVDTSAGSGLVHCAPGCGPEDYEVGHKNGLPAFNELDEHGKFKSSMGKYFGWKAKADDSKFSEELDKKGVLIAESPVEHEYPHCWRCKKPVVFRTTKQWFFKIEDLKENMRELNKSICWVPDYAGSRQFDSWLANLRDNSITRQRYWGTPVPIWKCSSCDNYEVIGSREELKKKTGKLPDDLHKPSLDKLTIKCKCGKEMKRIPDVLDVWIDSATASWNCLDYPGNDKLFRKMYPPDFILEGIDQIRGWFNILFVASMIAMNKPAYKSVYMHGFTIQSGEKMSKSAGNATSPQEIIDQYGADTMRYYLIGGTNPGLDLNYNIEDMKVSYRNLGILWNLHKLLIDLSNAVGKTPEKIKSPKLDIEEKFILSKLNSTLKNATKAFDEYRLNEIPHYAEELFLELSRTYIQQIREKVTLGTEKEKEVVCQEIRMYNDDIDTLVNYKMMSTVFNNALTIPVIGDEESVQSITRDDIIRFNEEFYSKEHMLISLGANVDYEYLVEKYFGMPDDVLLFSPPSENVEYKNTEEHIVFKDGQLQDSVLICFGSDELLKLSNTSRAKIKVTTFVDSAMHEAIMKCDLVLLGADAILKRGAINKIGSDTIAELSQMHKKPLYIVADSWKFSPKNVKIEERDFHEVWKNAPKQIKIMNPAFAMIDKKYIKGIVSEYGVLGFDKFVKKADRAI